VSYNPTRRLRRRISRLAASARFRRNVLGGHNYQPRIPPGFGTRVHKFARRSKYMPGRSSDGAT